VQKMTKLSAAIPMICVLVLAPTSASSARAQAKDQSPAQALLNLNQAAQQLITDPASEYEKGANPDFPYPSAIQQQWLASMSAYGTNLTVEERKLLPACAAKLNAAIQDMEIGYRIQVSQPSAAAQLSAHKRFIDAKNEAAQCSAALELAQSEVGSAPARSQPSEPQQGGVGANGANGSAIAGSASEAAQPGSIDWTPALNGLQTYLASEWQRIINDPANRSWAADIDGNTLTLKLQPGQVPEVLSASGSRSYVFNSIMQSSRVPVTNFPGGSTLTDVSIAPKFLVKPAPGKARTRYKYYERDGVFKSYLVAQ
jgi:hypothetical protein